MEVALEAAPLLVAGLDDPYPRGLDLGELKPDLDTQPRHLDRERRAGEHTVQQIRPLEQGRVVDFFALLATLLWIAVTGVLLAREAASPRSEPVVGGATAATSN